MRFTNLDCSLEGGFVYPSNETLHMSTRGNLSITIVLEVLLLLIDLLVASNICPEVIGCKLPLVLKGTQLLLELSSTALGKD